MTTTYAEAIATQTAEEIQGENTDAMVPLGVTVTGFSPTSVSRGLIALDARARAKEQRIRSEVVQAGFLVNVEARDPEWIDRYIEGFFSSGLDPALRLRRLRATKARHIFTLTNQSATLGAKEIKPLQLEASSVDAVKFRNITGGTLAAGIGSTLPLEFEAILPGLSGNIGPGELFKLTGGAIPGVDIANPPDSLTRAARNDETNIEYVTRALARWGTLAAGGHPFAVEFRILSAVETITKIGVRDDNPFGPGTVAVYLANPTGPASEEEIARAQAAFGPYEPLGSRGLWSYLPAVARNVTVEATMELDGANENAIVNAEEALALLQAQWPMRAGALLDTMLIGGILTGGEYEKYGLPGFRGVKNVDLISPEEDEALDVSEVLVLIPDLTEV